MSGNRPYSREVGAYPVAALRAAKHFPPVSRIDAAYGDRNLVCTCEPLEAYAAARPDHATIAHGCGPGGVRFRAMADNPWRRVR